MKFVELGGVSTYTYVLEAKVLDKIVKKVVYCTKLTRRKR